MDSDLRSSNCRGCEYFSEHPTWDFDLQIMRPECRCPRNCDYCELYEREED